MKKGLILLLVFAIIFSAASVNAQGNETTKQEKINLAYNWLSSAVSTWPSSTEDNALALLALSFDSKLASSGKSELMAKSNSNQCWPSLCRIQPTSVAILALSNLKENTETADSWLLSQEKSYTDSASVWYLQIDSDGSANCSVKYDGKSYPVTSNENKKLSSSAGTCLTLNADNYWLSISSSNNCLDKNYTINCNNDFVASTFYSKSGTIYVPGSVSSASSGNSIDVRIQTVCLSESGQCSYEGTLWAAYALAQKGKDSSFLIPYLLAQKDARFMPDALLYMATGNSEYATNLISSQSSDGSWAAANSPYSKIYDTALASLALKKYYSTANTDKAETWVLGQQNSDGSFGTLNKVRDTAIALYALWPKQTAVLATECENQGFYCESNCSSGEEEQTAYSASCSAGKCCKPSATAVCEVLIDCLKRECDGKIVKDDFGRTGTCEYGKEKTCYDGFDNDNNGFTDSDDPSCKTEKSCDELLGTVCISSETCQGGDMKVATDTNYCCVSGTCVASIQTCSAQGGTVCTEGGCSSYIKASDTSFCCKEGCAKGGISWWIILILVAAILIVLYLLYKNNVIKFGGKKKEIPKSRFPPEFPPMEAEVRKPFQPLTSQVQIQKQPIGLFRKPLKTKTREKTKKEEELEAAFKELKRISE